MHIRDVLAAKGHRIETVWPSQPAREIPKLLIERNIASIIVVSAEAQPMGIITDRHLLEAIIRTRDGLANLTARDVMTAPVSSCSPSDDIGGILARMTDERVRHMLVMEDGRMIGIVSIGDLVKHKLRDSDLEMRVLREMALAHMAAEQAPI
jgi:signal-transduction protein with cAMP-binding, CBS, and nucleotidyltransferase domain